MTSSILKRVVKCERVGRCRMGNWALTDESARYGRSRRLVASTPHLTMFTSNADYLAARVIHLLCILRQSVAGQILKTMRGKQNEATGILPGRSIVGFLQQVVDEPKAGDLEEHWQPKLGKRCASFFAGRMVRRWDFVDITLADCRGGEAYYSRENVGR